MSVLPTRSMDRSTPLSDMTIDQLYAVHGRTPTTKVIPERAPGPPRTRDDVRHPTGEDGPLSMSRRGETLPALRDDPIRPGRPKARLVRPADPGRAPAWVATPCGQSMELEIEIEGVGLALYPLACETPGEHPNLPHMMRVPGHDPADPGRRLDVFVGWADALE